MKNKIGIETREEERKALPYNNTLDSFHTLFHSLFADYFEFTYYFFFIYGKLRVMEDLYFPFVCIAFNNQ